MTRLLALPVTPAVAVLALVAVLFTAGCVSNAPPSAGAGTISVESSATECRLSSGTAPTGAITFRVKNTGDEVTEFYLLGEDGVRIVGEVENVGPGVTRDLVVQAAPGAYLAACKPGMVGDGIRSTFTVTGVAGSSAPSGALSQPLIGGLAAARSGQSVSRRSGGSRPGCGCRAAGGRRAAG